MVNYEILEKKVAYVQELLQDAKKYLDDYEKSKDKRDKLALEREIEKIVETSIKINKEMLKIKNKFPPTYKDSFLYLEILQVFEKKFLQESAETAIFRNELAHEYMSMSSFYSLENMKKIIKLYPKYFLNLVDFLENEQKKKDE
ncbi:MAG: HepT-like ribonuclease domain-containing protein [Candidatus Woesearchaeota archaeon]